MPGIGASPDARVSVFNDRKHVIRVPNLVGRVIGPAPVLVDTDADIKFLHQFLDRIEVAHRFRGNAVQVHRFREFEDLSMRRQASHALFIVPILANDQTAIQADAEIVRRIEHGIY